MMKTKQISFACIIVVSLAILTSCMIEQNRQVPSTPSVILPVSTEEYLPTKITASLTPTIAIRSEMERLVAAIPVPNGGVDLVTNLGNVWYHFEGSDLFGEPLVSFYDSGCSFATIRYDGNQYFLDMRSIDGEIINMVAMDDRPSIFQLSPDGKWLAYLKAYGEIQQLYAENYDLMIRSTDASSVAIKISQNRNVPPSDGFRWSPDGNQIAFSDTDSEGNSQLYLANMDGLEIRQITENHSETVYFTNLDWSPDARYLLFSLVDEETQIGEIFIYEHASNHASEMQLPSLLSSIDAVSIWQPDNLTVLLLLRQKESSNLNRVFVWMNAESGDVRQQVACDQENPICWYSNIVIPLSSDEFAIKNSENSFQFVNALSLENATWYTAPTESLGEWFDVSLAPLYGLPIRECLYRNQ